MPRPLNALIVEDSEDDALLSVRELSRGGFDVAYERVDTVNAMKAALNGRAWDVVISDYSMPHFDGLGALKVLRGTGLDVPFILISGAIGEELGVEAMRQGARDYIMKRNLGRLAPSVDRELREAEIRSKHRQAEESLRLRTQALNASANGIWIASRDGTIAWLNPAVAALSGYSEGELLGQNPRIFKSGKHDELFYSNLWTTILDGNIWHGEITNRRKDGALFALEETITPVRDRSGEVMSFIVVQQDITERKKMEEQLRHAQKMEVVGRLSAGMAYDFDHLLTTIMVRSAIGMLHTDAQMRASWREVHDAAKQATSLIQDLLTFSRGQVPHPEIMDLGVFVANGIVKNLKEQLSARTELVARTWPDLWRVQIDRGQVEQIIVSLASNASDAMPEGGKLTVETTNLVADEEYSRNHDRVAPGRYVLLEVADTGCGMDEETQSHIFEPFFTTKERSKGKGLGLAAVYGIVKQNRGYIWAHSKLGIGSNFRVYLPALAD